MPYGPHTPDDRAQMLAALGISTVDELFADIPRELRASPLNLPPPEPELELSARLSGLARRNRVDMASFLGAGAYRHYTPAVVDQLLLRGEWYTAYTPYQPEVSQGTLQSIYEYESLIAELTGLDVVSASHYDGAAATAEGALMTCRATRRERVLVSRAVHPDYRATIRTYLSVGGLVVDEIPLVADGPAAGTTEALVRQIPGRLVGLTKDLDGRRAFVMTLRAREQDIRREKAASNICTNQALLALAASIYLAAIGPHGLRDVAALGAAHAAALEDALADAGAPRLHPGPYLNEFAIRVPDAAAVHRGLLDRDVLAGLVLAEAEPEDPSLADGLLVCATEVTTKDDIDRFASALRAELRKTDRIPAVPVAGGVAS